MSAIFGLIHLDNQLVIPDELERMSRACAPLGPDGGGTFIERATGLGYCLMRFTPEDKFEQKPWLSTDRQTVLVCDIRLDNREELTRELAIPFSEMCHLPDSAYVLTAYEKWGEDCVQHLVGDYAFALWNARDQRLFLARSAVGGRPLYYYATSNLFAFASTPKGLFTLPNIPRSLNLERIADYLVHAPIEPGTSFFRDIRRLHAGHVLTVCRSVVKERRFWQPELLRELRYRSDDEYVNAFNELFELVVAAQLRSVSPVGVMMSGGLDSTSVAAVAATQLKQHGKRLATYTEVPRSGFDGCVVRGRYADETLFVQAMSRQYGNIDLNLIRTDNRMFLDDLDGFFDLAYMPFRNASNRIWFEAILQEARNQGVHVLLTGAQGNLTISRSGQGLLPMLIRTGKWWQALHEAHAAGKGTLFRTLGGQGVLPLLPTPLFLLVQYLRGQHRPTAGSAPWSAYSAINPDFARSQRVRERASEKGCDFHLRLKPDIRLTFSKMLPGLTMAANEIYHAYRGLYGVDLRDPTADLRIVEFCLSLPEEQYLKDGVSRRLIRRAMAARLPAEILANRQRGLQAAGWFERLLASRESILLELGEWQKDELLSGILDLQRMVRLVEQMPHANGDADRIMMDYRQVLEFGLMTGRFVRWLENGASLNA